MMTQSYLQSSPRAFSPPPPTQNAAAKKIHATQKKVLRSVSAYGIHFVSARGSASPHRLLNAKPGIAVVGAEDKSAGPQSAKPG